MPGVAQRRTKLGGQWYDRGAVVPDEVITDRTVSMGLVVRSSSSGEEAEELAAELERTKAELAETRRRLADAEGRKAPAPGRAKRPPEPGGNAGDE